MQLCSTSCSPSFDNTRPLDPPPGRWYINHISRLRAHCGGKQRINSTRHKQQPHTMSGLPLPPIICFQCGTDQNPCHCKVRREPQIFTIQMLTSPGRRSHARFHCCRLPRCAHACFFAGAMIADRFADCLLARLPLLRLLCHRDGQKVSLRRPSPCTNTHCRTGCWEHRRIYRAPSAIPSPYEQTPLAAYACPMYHSPRIIESRHAR